MEDKRARHRAKLKKLRTSYAAKLPRRLNELEELVARVVDSDTVEKTHQALHDIHAQAHNLAGSGGTFGFAALSDAAQQLEFFTISLLDESVFPTAEQYRKTEKLLSNLIMAGNKPQSDNQTDTSAPAKQPIVKKNQTKTILLAEDNPDQAARLKIGLSAFGYDVKTIDKPEKIQDAIDTCKPVAIILDLELGDGRASGAQSIQKTRLSVGIDCPLIVLTAYSTFESRLASVRAGCDQFLTKPVKLDDVVSVLENFTTPKEAEPEHVLVIDDDLDILEFTKATLESSEMIVECLSDPSSTLEKMEEFRPEVVIVDLLMPKCNGREVAAIIRQRPEFMGIPIVFLSAETDKDVQLKALGSGADDFLIKPINPNHLVSTIRLRVERFRALRNLMRRDSMTGLYNHATTWQLFETELSRARRSNAPVSFAMVDIDHFKSVNDTLGHGVGDTVLKALSKILMHRLRKGDIVGRLGGEEFGVVLPSTSVDQARSVMEGIRLSFAEISQNAAGSDKPITLSCGIAAFPRYASASELAEAADRALYEAKETGRNKTVLVHAEESRPRDSAVSSTDLETTDGQQPTRAGGSEAATATVFGHFETPSTLKSAIVIDDDPIICEFIKPFAESAGFHVETHIDPELFVKTDHTNADLIMLDLNMPAMDGIEVLRFLGKNKCRAAIIIISGYDREILTAARALAKRQGLNIVDILSKPFDPGELEKALEVAFNAPEAGKNKAKRSMTKELPLVEDLREAIEQKNLDVYYQPKVRLSDQAVVGAEALVRWNHPVKGFVSPEYFVGLAEQNDLIDDLTLFVLTEACAFLKRCRTAGHSLTISVNISERSFGNLSFPERISAIVIDAGLSSSDITLELTETSLSADITYIIDALTRLRMKGFEISIDDFGTGHSSLSRLNEMPFSELKIDQSFVGRAHAEAGARAIVKNTIDLARGLGLKTVAEGAETQEDMDILEGFNCDLVQGYFISRPIPPNEFIAWAEVWKNSLSSRQKLTSSGSRHVVLCVDDNPMNVKRMETMLGQFEDIKLLTAGHAELGVNLATKHRPDLILMDINMPEMDGYEALERLRIIEETRSIPIIAVTEQATNAEIRRGRHAGFSDYITRPNDAENVIKAIKGVLDH